MFLHTYKIQLRGANSTVLIQRCIFNESHAKMHQNCYKFQILWFKELNWCYGIVNCVHGEKEKKNGWIICVQLKHTRHVPQALVGSLIFVHRIWVGKRSTHSIHSEKRKRIIRHIAYLCFGLVLFAAVVNLNAYSYPKTERRFDRR